MKINAISASSSLSNNKSKNTLLDNTFKGYVNGKFYKDEIIEKAKQAVKKPEILKNYKHKSLLDTYLTWHKGNMAHSTGERVTLAVLTLGLSEISWTFFARLGDLEENATNKKEFEDIISCMQDLANEK